MTDWTKTIGSTTTWSNEFSPSTRWGKTAAALNPQWGDLTPYLYLENLIDSLGTEDGFILI